MEANPEDITSLELPFPQSLTPFLCLLDLLASFPVAAITYPNKSNSRENGLISAHSSSVLSVMERKSGQQECEAPNSAMSIIKEQ